MHHSPFPRLRGSLALLLPLVALGVACEAEVEPIDVSISAECEWTNDIHCLLPWPSNRWLEDDSTTESGKRLAYPEEAIPKNKDDDPFDVEPYRHRDGFSPTSSILTSFHTPVDVEASTGLATEGNWDHSLANDSPTVIVDLSTGEHIAHFAENDLRADDNVEGYSYFPTLFYLRPAAALTENRSYGVALRNIVLSDGTAGEATPVFAALRDGVPTTDATVEAARPAYEALFSGLEAAGVERASLSQAWTFHTASGSNLRNDLILMRNDALSRVPVGGGECTVEEFRDDASPDNLLARIKLNVQVPLYMDQDEPGASLVRDADGNPSFQGWIDVPFYVLLPRSLAAEGAGPARLLVFGHGLMGSASGEGTGGFLRGFANEHHFVTAATDWQGMSDRDTVNVARALGDLSNFYTVPQRVMQGMINQLVMTRALTGACGDLPELQVDGVGPAIADGAPYFLGISQGGIYGGTLLALSTEFERGALLVGAMNYPIMTGRSLDFETYEIILKAFYYDRIDRELLMNLASSMWDYAEPGPWLAHLTKDPVEGTAAKKLLYQTALNDCQVPNLASDMGARTIGLPLLNEPLEQLYGLETADGPTDSAYVVYDTGVPTIPPGNIAPSDDSGSHSTQRYVEAARQQINAFFQPDGQIQSFCEGPCNPN